jgi:hypothetical protein
MNPAEAAKRDLDQLRSTYDPISPAIHVIGITSDAANLHRYVGRLAPSPLFATAKIESLEAVTSDVGVTGSRFELRLQIRPGFGQPGGPTEPLIEPATALASQPVPSAVNP